MPTKKKNPMDLTTRNLTKTRRDIADLRRKVRQLEDRVKTLWYAKA